MFRSVLVVACIGLVAGNEVVDTMKDYETMGKIYAGWAKSAAPTDDETLRNVLAAGAGASAAASGCPGGCSFLETDSETPGVQIQSDSKDLLKRLNVHVGKQQEIPQSLLDFVAEYNQKRDAEEQAFLASALHSKPASFLERSKLPFELRIGASTKRFPNFFEAVKAMEVSRDASEQHIRDQLISMLGQKGSFLENESSPMALAETIAQLQKKVYESPEFGKSVIAAFQGKQSQFLRRPTPEINVKYEYPVSEKKPTISFAEIEERLKEQSGVFAKLDASVKHSAFLRNAGEYDRKTQAPIVWLHLNHGSFLEQAVTPNIDLYLEQMSG